MTKERVYGCFVGIDLLSATQEEVLAYEARLKQVLDEEAARIEAELREKEAREEGKTEERTKIAISMLRENVDVNTISKFTELTIGELEELKNSMRNGSND